MDNTERKEIKLIVQDEQSLYQAFSPEDEFDDSVKSYIRQKIADDNYHNCIDLTVISQVPLDEDRFRSAAANWIRTEKILFRRNEKKTRIKLFGALIVASVFIILSLVLEREIDVLKYSLLPVLGSFALGNAAGILVEDVPTIRVERWMFSEIEKNSVITFKYDQTDTDS